MKLRLMIKSLKKKNFVILSYWGDFAITHINNALSIYGKREYDNGLYIEDGWNENSLSWTKLKHILKEEKLLMFVENGHCPRCGCLLTEQNYKNEIEDSFYTPFEYDFFYCNDCKQKQIEDFVKFTKNYENYEDE